MKKPTTLQLAFHTTPTTFDPRKSGDFISSTLICLLYEGLTRCDAKGGVEPALAKDIEISPDGLTYTFFLRDAVWSDGMPVTAYDFERSWKQILNPSFPSLSSYLLFPIKNAESYARGDLLSSEVAINALDAKTLRVELERPTSYFLSLTAFPLFLPAPSHLEKLSPDSLVLNGPFLLEKYIPNNEIHLVKNSQFWNAEQTSFEAIHISIVADENTALQMFEQKKLDWIGAPFISLPSDSLPLFQDRLRFIPMAASTFCTLNTEAFPFQNPSLRKALALALDCETLIQKSTLIGQIPVKHCLPPSLFPKFERSLPSFDPQKAREILNKALEELGVNASDLASITIYYKSNQVDKRLALTIQQQWKEVLGLDFKLEQLDPKIHMEKLHSRNYQIAIASWIAQFNDPINLLERYRLPSNPKNFAGWQHPQYANLLQQAAWTLESNMRFDLLSEAENILASELPIIPLYHWTSPTLCSPHLENVVTTPAGGVLFEKFTLHPEAGNPALKGGVFSKKRVGRGSKPPP